MIKNIIFDMGNVLLDFDPEAAVRRLPVEPTAQQFIKELLFASPEWVAFDRGDLTEEAVLQQLSARAPAELRGTLKECLHTWHETMVPLPGAKDFLRELKEKGYRLFVLSNASKQFWTYFPREIDVSLFDGVVVSCDVHLLKPDARIYRHLLDTYSLDPNECLFIDDRADNVRGAEQVGIKGLVFEGDYDKLGIYRAIARMN